MQLGDSSKKFIQIHPRKIFSICSPFRIHPKSRGTHSIFPSHHFQVLSEIFQGCILPPNLQGKITKPPVSKLRQYQGYMEQKSRCGLGKPWISGGFFLTNQNRGDWIGCVGKMNGSCWSRFFFFATSFFASGFLLQMDFAIIDLKQF